MRCSYVIYTRNFFLFHLRVSAIKFTRRCATANRSRVSNSWSNLENFFSHVQFDNHAKFGCCFSYCVRACRKSQKFGGGRRASLPWELQTWYRDGVRWPALPTCAVTSKVKGQGYNVTSSVWRVFAHNSTKESRRSTKIGGNDFRATADTAHYFRGQKVADQVTTCRGEYVYCGYHTRGRTA